MVVNAQAPKRGRTMPATRSWAGPTRRTPGRCSDQAPWTKYITDRFLGAMNRKNAMAWVVGVVRTIQKKRAIASARTLKSHPRTHDWIASRGSERRRTRKNAAMRASEEI